VPSLPDPCFGNCGGNGWVAGDLNILPWKTKYFELGVFRRWLLVVGVVIRLMWFFGLLFVYLGVKLILRNNNEITMLEQ
jgi:hypothetical protein